MSDLNESQKLPPESGRSTHPAPAPLELKGHQIALREALRPFVLPETNQTLSDLYSSCLFAIGTNDPCRFQTAAHHIREILEKLPEQINRKVSAKRPASLGSLVPQLVQKWRSLLQSPLWQDLLWRGKSVDQKLEKFLQDFHSFAVTFESDRPLRQQLKANLLAYFSASNRKLPEGYLDGVLEQWDTLDKYFKLMSHNRLSLEAEVFQDRLDRCEQLLLRIIQPRTLEDLDELDALISQGESS